MTTLLWNERIVQKQLSINFVTMGPYIVNESNDLQYYHSFILSSCLAVYTSEIGWNMLTSESGYILSHFVKNNLSVVMKGYVQTKLLKV